MNSKVLLGGIKFFSNNRGVSALGYSAVGLLDNSFHNSITILTPWMISDKQLLGDEKYPILKYTKLDFFITFFESILFRYLKIKPISSFSVKLKSYEKVFLVNEGDSFSDIYGIKRYIRHAMDCYLAIWWKIDLIFLPQTIGPFNKWVTKKSAIKILKHTNKLYVRDTQANELLNKYKIKYMTDVDMAFYLRKKLPCINEDFKIEKDNIGININGLIFFNSYKSMDKDSSKYEELIVNIINKFLELKKTIILIPHTYDVLSNRKQENDFYASKTIKQKYFNGVKNVKLISNNYGPHEIKYIISKLSFFIGSRMHSCIAALSSEVPSIGIAYSYKFKGTFRNVGMEKCALSLKDLPTGQIVHNIFINYNNRDTLQNILKSNIQKILKEKHIFN